MVIWINASINVRSFDTFKLLSNLFRYSLTKSFLYHSVLLCLLNDNYFLGGIPVAKSNLDIFLAIYDALTPKNRTQLVALLEEAVRNQSASIDSQDPVQQTSG